jgi:diguanylate cyclase (GGDEF)-like protein
MLTYFWIGCIIAGIFVGVFCYFIVIKVLRSIDLYFKTRIKEVFGTYLELEKSNEWDLLLNMKADFEILIQHCAKIFRKENERLKREAFTDSLTTLFNQNYIYEYFDSKVFQSEYPMAVLFCDIDDFKQINDYCGHPSGNYVLSRIGDILKNGLRENDICFRYGGEEFLIVLSNTDLTEAYEIAERLRNEISKQIVLHYDQRDKVTVSIGISAYPYHGNEIDELIQKADEAMYLVKNSGKNQTQIYSYL